MQQRFLGFRGCGVLLADDRPAPGLELVTALSAVDAWEWAQKLGLDSVISSGGQALDPAQVQQLALARLILVDSLS